MKVKNLVSKRYKETPADCQIDSQALMMRGGYIKPVANGIYTLFSPTVKITQKIMAIIREEMNRIDGQEVLFPVAMPGSLWHESGRYTSIGRELLRFTDRTGSEMVLGMTHEEASVQLIRDVIDSYQQYPFMIYQFQTKFRDEPRSRGGLIRVREFTMKDGYSFHTSMEDLEAYYDRYYEAYERIFKRVGLRDVVAVKSDSGMMGGKVSHEFMLLTDVGEDTLVLCRECDYRANMEAAPCIHPEVESEDEPLEKHATPDKKTIEEVSGFLGVAQDKTIKAVAYRREDNDGLVIAFLRGDLEVNETKLRNYLKTEIYPDTQEETPGLVHGFIGPMGLTAKAEVVFDSSLKNARGMVVGANEVDMHYKGFSVGRDLAVAEFVDVAKVTEDMLCPVCGGKHLRIARGIEIGNIFQLGTRYSESMGLTYTDEDGSLKSPIMGSYGIGIGRLAASICEESHDQNGPVWPMPVAPWQVEICSLRADQEEVKAVAESLYAELSKDAVDVLFDDRSVSAGVMFADADLFGAPIRAVVSPKNLKDGVVELSARDKSFVEKVPVEEAAKRIEEIIRREMERYTC